MIEYKRLQIIFQTLSDANRLKILHCLCNCECSVSDLANTTRLSQPLVSHHLRILKENEFLKTRREGPFIFYSIRDERILDAVNVFIDVFRGSSMISKNAKGFCRNTMNKNCN